MKKEIADKLVTALRSGEYDQSKLQLRTQEGYCCLGVLCDLYDKEQMARGQKSGWTVQYSYTLEGYMHRYNDASATTPLAVQLWAGLKTDTGAYNQLDDGGYEYYLSDLNDSGATFDEIAVVIEENYEQL